MTTLRDIAEQISNCQRCPLHYSRRHPVPGEGPSNAKIMFIGEAPGYHEDRQGRPFVGASGHLLEELLNDVGIQRHDVFITNVVKCRPPGNRDPEPEEIEACKPFLEQQIEIIRPKLIVTLGRFSMQRYFPKASISRIHGQPKRANGRIYYPMFHPAAALHQPRWRAALEEDVRRIPDLLAELEAMSGATGEDAAANAVDDNYEQLSLF